jgi:hypothetical protein
MSSRLAARAAARSGDTKIPPAQRLCAWLAAMLAAKQAKARDDLELFAAYRILAAEHSCSGKPDPCRPVTLPQPTG